MAVGAAHVESPTVESRRETPALSSEERARIDRWIESSKSIRMLVTGKTGVGKSTLVNALVGEYVAKEGDTLNPETRDVEKCNVTLSGVDVTLWDTPGLQDASQREDEYIKAMEDKCKELDLVLYCTRMDEARFREGDYEAINKLTSSFGSEFWKNAVVVLTFANMVRPLRGANNPVKVRSYFLSRLAQWETKMREVVKDSGVEKQIAETLPIVPAGYVDDPSLPDREEWLGSFWFACLGRMRGSAQPAMLKINAHRLLPSETSQDDQPLCRRQIKPPTDVSTDEAGFATTAVIGGYVVGAIIGVSLGPVGFAVGGAAGLATGSTIALLKTLIHDEKHSS